MNEGVIVILNENSSILIKKAIIDDDKLKIPKGLVKNAVDGFPYVLFGIVCRHDYTYLGEKIFPSLNHFRA